MICNEKREKKATFLLSYLLNRLYSILFRFINEFEAKFMDCIGSTLFIVNEIAISGPISAPVNCVSVTTLHERNFFFFLLFYKLLNFKKKKNALFVFVVSHFFGIHCYIAE